MEAFVGKNETLGKDKFEQCMESVDLIAQVMQWRNNQSAALDHLLKKGYVRPADIELPAETAESLLKNWKQAKKTN